MASFPGPKVHRASRRKLGRGQFPPVVAATVAATASSDVATLTYSQPVIANATPPLTVTGLTPLSWAQSSPTVITVTYPSALTGLTYTYAGGSSAVVTKQGGQVAPAAGTF
jgi:hypothetical protein